MAKKSRKPNLPQETLERARKELYGGGASAPSVDKPQVSQVAKTRKTKSQAQPVYQEADLSKEYAYVISDLRNMGVLASILMLILVILSFFI